MSSLGLVGLESRGNRGARAVYMTEILKNLGERERECR